MLPAIACFCFLIDSMLQRELFSSFSGLDICFNHPAVVICRVNPFQPLASTAGLEDFLGVAEALERLQALEPLLGCWCLARKETVRRGFGSLSCPCVVWMCLESIACCCLYIYIYKGKQKETPKLQTTKLQTKNLGQAEVGSVIFSENFPGEFPLKR